MAREGVKWPALPLSVYLLLAILLVTAPVVCLISVVDYVGTARELEENADEFQDQAETGIVLSMTLVDTGLNLFDETLDHRMEEGFGPVLAEYERAKRDPGKMDLSRVREELGGEMEIYVINESGVIEYTTYEPDLGLDFRTIPDFYDRLTEIRLGDAFVADRVVTEISTGKLRKYAYMPSPDHRYVLELGLVCSAAEVDRFDPKYQTLKEDLMRLNPALEGIRIYDGYGRVINVTESESPADPAAINPVARAVFEEKQDRTLTDAAAGRFTRYILVDLSAPDTPSDTSRVIELTYSTAPLDTRLSNIRFSHIILAVFASLAACCIAVPVSRQVTRPIQKIVEDVDIIARGDLDHRIRVSPGTELTRLSESIGTMVASLKENIQRLRVSEETLRQYGTQLEDQVRARTAELEASNQTAALYLDIMVHDINNANTIAIGYTQVLVEMLEGERRETARRMLSRLERSSEIINRVAALRRARETRAAPVRVDLDRVIRAEAADHPAARIRYEGRPVTVLADDLLPEVFANLIGNAVKFGGPDVEITIRVEEHGDEIVVSVEDTGPGIPDKNGAFRRFGKGEGSLAGAGLGLYICRMLVERYGGRIWVDDRVPGRPECGSALRFTLRKAPGE